MSIVKRVCRSTSVAIADLPALPTIRSPSSGQGRPGQRPREDARRSDDPRRLPPSGTRERRCERPERSRLASSRRSGPHVCTLQRLVDRLVRHAHLRSSGSRDEAWQRSAAATTAPARRRSTSARSRGCRRASPARPARLLERPQISPRRTIAPRPPLRTSSRVTVEVERQAAARSPPPPRRAQPQARSPPAQRARETAANAFARTGVYHPCA